MYFTNRIGKSIVKTALIVLVTVLCAYCVDLLYRNANISSFKDEKTEISSQFRKESTRIYYLKLK
jgi:hypothetical protein